MRSVLVEWLYDVTQKYATGPDILFSAIHIIDRFLAVEPINRNKLQLLGSVALVLASKYEGPARLEIEITQVTPLTLGAYTTNEAVEMEWTIATVLEWRFNCPHVFS
jgi:cyclin A